MTGNAVEYSNRMRSLIVFVSLLLIYSGCSRKRAEDSLTAADSLKSMRLSEDFHVELFASELQAMSPVGDGVRRGRPYLVAEMMDYPDDPPQASRALPYPHARRHGRRRQT